MVTDTQQHLNGVGTIYHQAWWAGAVCRASRRAPVSQSHRPWSWPGRVDGTGRDEDEDEMACIFLIVSTHVMCTVEKMDIRIMWQFLSESPCIPWMDRRPLQQVSPPRIHNDSTDYGLASDSLRDGLRQVPGLGPASCPREYQPRASSPEPQPVTLDTCVYGRQGK